MPVGFLCNFRYKDAVLDDARLVFRIIRETVRDGGTALNYARAEEILFDARGLVNGVVLRDTSSEKPSVIEIKANAVVNASGPWSDQVRADLHAPDKLRPLRGSHIILPFARLPVTQAVTFFHPRDKRAMFVIPWEGTTMVGTTDIDHGGDAYHPDHEPYAAHDEIVYILEGVAKLFPQNNISKQDILSTFAGLRPVVNTGAETPSKESRAHQVWVEKGLVTISGGKLTTFRVMARDTLDCVSQTIGKRIAIDRRSPMLKPVQMPPVLGSTAAQPRLLGRSGQEAQHILRDAIDSDLQSVNGLPALWIELGFAARAEAILHLDDLLLRRTRIGMLLPEGGRSSLPEIKEYVQDKLGWSQARWQSEQERYLNIWKRAYSPDPGN